MADHIPFITGEDGSNLVKKVYPDSDIIRVRLDRAPKFLPLPASSRLWLDPCLDGLDDISTRRVVKRRNWRGQEQTSVNPWFTFMSRFEAFEKVATSLATPVTSEVAAFVHAVLEESAEHEPAWLTVPQIPLVDNADRNKINRLMASATGRWKSKTGFIGHLILPLIFTNQKQINGKTARNPKVRQAERCYHEAQADGVWVVDKSLVDDNGSSTLRNKRLPGVIALHEELNERISPKIRIAGPYWGLNLVLWARGLVDYPAIGIGSMYQYLLTGGPTMTPSAKLALPSLRRRVGVGPQFKTWLDSAITKLAPSHPAHAEFGDIRKHYTVLSEPARAREQVATFYKRWFNIIASAPKAGRSMALFQDLSAAYALGKSLPDLDNEGTARRPEAVAEPLMLSCL
ncbi:MAG: hypothetical protein NTU94_08920 [Planctomycetota bacterium]|nr:hypothetical protein [Planctomycetota bacterium]